MSLDATVTPGTAATPLSLDGARRALEDMSRRARLLIDTANDAVVSIDDVSVIVDCKRAEAALRESEEKYRQVVENAYEGIVVSQDGMLRYANPRALALTKRTLEQTLTTPFIEMVHPDDRARVYGNYLRRMRGEAVEPTYVFRALAATGEVVWIQISAVAIDWESRPATLNFLTDVSDRVALEAHLNDT